MLYGFGRDLEVLYRQTDLNILHEVCSCIRLCSIICLLSSKCPCPQVSDPLSCAPAPTALCLWLDPHSGGACPPALGSTTHVRHYSGTHHSKSGQYVKISFT